MTPRLAPPQCPATYVCVQKGVPHTHGWRIVNLRQTRDDLRADWWAPYPTFLKRWENTGTSWIHGPFARVVLPQGNVNMAYFLVPHVDTDPATAPKASKSHTFQLFKKSWDFDNQKPTVVSCRDKVTSVKPLHEWDILFPMSFPIEN